MYLFPAIDIRAGQIVRLQQGDYARETTYGDDPLAQARLFAQVGASWLHVVDLDGARTGEPVNIAQVERIVKETQLKVEVGGGVRNTATIDRLLHAGVERVVLGTAALKNWAWFETLTQQPAYRQRLVLGLDARAGRVAVSGWEKQLDASAIEVAQRVSAWPLAAIVFTDIATDGTMAGPNLVSTGELARATKVPVVASGGVGTLEHLRALKTLPVQGVIVGRAIYEKRFTVAEALAVLEEK